MSLQDVIAKLIKQEIENDPMEVGYKGKTDDEITVMLNSGVARSVTNYFTEQTPISRILSGVGYAPNVCEKSDITLAQSVVLYVKPIEEIIPNG
jgi:hypothetical protein